MTVSRRAVLASAVAALAPAATSARKPGISIFSKHLRFLEGAALADAAAEAGFDGIDLAVRAGGHVEPERVKDDLPKLVGLIRKRGLDVPMITSDIVDADTPHAERVLRTIADLGIRNYRWGGFRYEAGKPVLPQLEALKPRVSRLATMNIGLGVCAMYHTHSGVGQVGASIWDLYLLLKDFDPNAVAFNYDIGHATVEGGAGGWINSFSITGNHLRGVAVKDFVWGRDGKGNWRPQWMPLGEGMVRMTEFLRMLAQRNFQGPIQLHCEYPMGGAESGKIVITWTREQVLAVMKRDLLRLRGWAKETGLTS